MRAAAPFAPPTHPLLSVSARTIFSRCFLAIVGKRGYHASGTCDRKGKTSPAAKLPEGCQAVGSPPLALECVPCSPAFQDLSWILIVYIDYEGAGAFGYQVALYLNGRHLKSQVSD
jgi:hypothetical protein